MKSEISINDIKLAYKNKIEQKFISEIIKKSEYHFTSTLQQPEFISHQNSNNSFKKLKKKNPKKKKKQLSKCSSSFNVENASKDMKVWYIFRENKEEGPFLITKIFDIIKTSYDPSLILIKNTKENKLFTTDFFLDTYKKQKTPSSHSSIIKEPLFSKNTSDRYEKSHIVTSLNNEYPINTNIMNYSNSFGYTNTRNEKSNDNLSTIINRNNSNPDFEINQNQPIINKFSHSFKDYGKTPFSKGGVSIESDDSDGFNPFEVIDNIKDESEEGEFDQSDKTDYLYKEFLEGDRFGGVGNYFFPNEKKSSPLPDLRLMSNRNERYYEEREKSYDNHNYLGKEDYGNDYNDVCFVEKEKYQKNENRKNGSFFSCNLELETKNEKFRNKKKSLNALNKKDSIPYKNNRHQKNNNKQNYQENFGSSWRMKNSYKSEKPKKKKSHNVEEESDYYYKKEQNTQQNEGYKKKSSYNPNKKHYKKKYVNSKTNRFYVKKNEN